MFFGMCYSNINIKIKSDISPIHIWWTVWDIKIRRNYAIWDESHKHNVCTLIGV